MKIHLGATMCHVLKYTNNIKVHFSIHTYLNLSFQDILELLQLHFTIAFCFEISPKLPTQ